MSSKRARSPIDRSHREERSVRSKRTEDTFSCRYVVNRKEGSGLIGRGGSVIQGIQRTCSVHCSFDSDSRGTSEQAVTVKGTPEQCAHTAYVMALKVAEIRQGQDNKEAVSEEELAEQPARFDLLVLQSNVGRIIGKRGERIKRIQETTGCKVDIDSHPHPLSQMPEQLVSVSGLPAGIQAALEQILVEISRASPAPDMKRMPRAPPAYAMPQYSQLRPSMGGYPDMYGMPMPHPDMYMDPRDYRDSRDSRDVRDMRHGDMRHGDMRHGDMRHGDMRHGDMRHGYAPRPRSPPRRSRHAPRGGGDADVLMIKLGVQVPQVGLLIGRGGSVIQTISRESGAKLYFNKQRMTSAEPRCSEMLWRLQCCDISGTLEQVNIALDFVLRKIADGDDKTPGRDEDGRMSMVMMVPAKVIGWLVGKGGVKIKATTQETGATIRVFGGREGATQDADGQPLNAVNIEGHEDAVLAATLRLATQLFEQQQHSAGRREGREPQRAERAERSNEDEPLD